MIYCVLVVFLLQWVIPWSIAALSFNNIINRKSHHMIDCFIAHDLFIKDIFDSSSEKIPWIILSPTTILWQKADKTSVEWSYDSNNIYRTVGIYNKDQSQWLKKHTDLLLRQVTNAFFTIDQASSSIGLVTLNIAIDNHHYFFTASGRYAYF